MHVTYNPETLAQVVVNEIKYFVSFSVLKRLLEQEKIKFESFQQANIAIAEKYGVSQLYI